jgi:glucose-1-phosphate thymidylyltransferase
MKGIILAGGTGTRLYPLTHQTSKQLLPVYNKPMIYYPLATLMLAKIKDILIISSTEYIEAFRSLLGDGSRIGINIQYSVQDKPEGIAQAFHIGESFIGEDSVCLMLGDNFLYGHMLPDILISQKKKIENSGGASIFGYNVLNPSDYGVATVDGDRVLSIEEKPKNPKSNWAVIGLYMYDNTVKKVSREIKPSDRNELEITSVNNEYLKNDCLSISLLGRGYTWFDTGNSEDLFTASSFVRTIEKRQGLKIACLEEIAYYMGYITREHLQRCANSLKNTEYGNYLNNLIEKEDIFKYEQS